MTLTGEYFGIKKAFWHWFGGSCTDRLAINRHRFNGRSTKDNGILPLVSPGLILFRPFVALYYKRPSSSQSWQPIHLVRPQHRHVITWVPWWQCHLKRVPNVENAKFFERSERGSNSRTALSSCCKKLVPIHFSKTQIFEYARAFLIHCVAR